MLQGGLIAPQSIVALENAADLVVDGTATGFVQNGGGLDFSVHVNRVLKGDGTLTGSSIRVHIWLSGTQAAAATVGSNNAGGTGIWFFQRTSGPWQVVPVVQGTTRLSDIYIAAQLGAIISAYAYSATASGDDKLASEICSAIEGVIGVRGISLEMYALLSGGIDELNSSVPQLLYHRLASSASTEQQILGLSGLIRSGDSLALTAAAQVASAVTGGPAEGVLLLSVREYLRPTDSASVTAIGQVATDSALPTALGSRRARFGGHPHRHGAAVPRNSTRRSRLEAAGRSSRRHGIFRQRIARKNKTVRGYFVVPPASRERPIQDARYGRPLRPWSTGNRCQRGPVRLLLGKLVVGKPGHLRILTGIARGGRVLRIALSRRKYPSASSGFTSKAWTHLTIS